MKNAIELCLFLSNIQYIENLEETLEIIPHPGPELNDLLDLNQVTNQKSLVKIKKLFLLKEGPIFTDVFDRVYFGNEVCERLIPSLKVVEKAYRLLQEKKLDLTFVTPYVSYNGIQQLETIFEYLNSLENIEVVVNDFGVLNLVTEKYTNIKPVLGRLLVKMKRDPRYSLSDFDFAVQKIKNPEKVGKNQINTASSNSLENKRYQDFLKNSGVERICIDSVPTVPDKSSIKKWGFPVDLIWPWTYITSGRNCAIAAHTQQGKLNHPTDEACNFQCKKFEFIFESDKVMLPSVQRGMAVWMNTTTLIDSYFNLGISRLVYTPYVPI